METDGRPPWACFYSGTFLTAMWAHERLKKGLECRFDSEYENGRLSDYTNTNAIAFLLNCHRELRTNLTIHAAMNGTGFRKFGDFSATVMSVSDVSCQSTYRRHLSEHLTQIKKSSCSTDVLLTRVWRKLESCDQCGHSSCSRTVKYYCGLSVHQRGWMGCGIHQEHTSTHQSITCTQAGAHCRLTGSTWRV